MAVVVAFPRSGVPADALSREEAEKSRPGFGEIVILPCVRRERLAESSESEELARHGPVAQFN